MFLRNQISRPMFYSGFLVIFMSFFALFAMSQDVSAVEPCFVDQQGANDEPGQKDLNEVCIDESNAPATIEVSWNWDDTEWSGNNTGDACLLFDTDNDGNANTAACLYVGGSPASIIGSELYTCNDSRSDRCAGKKAEAPVDGSLTSCSAGVQAEDPFDSDAPNGPGDFHPDDTVATCTIDLRDVGGETAAPIDVCSYPSGEPNSDPSDCVIQPDSPTAISLAEPLSADMTATPIAPAAAAMGGLMLLGLLLWKRKDNS